MAFGHLPTSLTDTANWSLVSGIHTRVLASFRSHLAKLKVKSAVIDGELVCLDSEGRSIFNELLHRKGRPTFYAFDLLYLNGRDLRQLPLLERKEKLRALIEKSGLPGVICGKYVEVRLD
jgi:ATP-dependent DNA ligase